MESQNSSLMMAESGFREVGKATGVGSAPKSGMNATVGDILNNGKFAIYVTNISEEGVLIQGNNLWVPRDGTEGDASSTTISRGQWESSWVAGALVRSSAT